MNLTNILFTGFGAAILAGIFYGLTEITSKFLVKTKQFSVLTVLINEYIFGSLFFLTAALAIGQFTLNGATLFYAFLSTLVLSLGVYLHATAISKEDFSLTLPFLAFTPIFLIPIEFLFFKIVPSNLALAGIFLIILGTFALSWSENKTWKIIWQFSASSKIMILVAFLYAFGGIFDKLGTLASSPSGYLFWSFAFLTIVFYPINLFINRGKINWEKPLTAFKKNILAYLAIGLAVSLASFLMMTSYQTILVNYAVSIKRACYLVPIMLGPVLFKEKNLLRRLPGVLMMLGGAIIIIIFG